MAKRKTLLEKIKDDEFEEFSKFMKRYNKIPLFNYNMSDYDVGRFWSRTLSYPMDINTPDNYSWSYTPARGSNYIKTRRVVNCLISVELNKLIKAKIANREACKRVKTMLKGDVSSIKLAMVVVNNWRNKRVRKEKTKKK